MSSGFVPQGSSSPAPASLAVAAPNRLSAEAAAEIAKQGGNAVDAALASIMVACIVEPGVCAPGAGGFIAMTGPDIEPVVIDGYMRAPLRTRTHHLDAPVVAMEYGGGIQTRVGPGSVAVPGCWAAFGRAHAMAGRMTWAEVCSPAVAVADAGFPLGGVSAYYLQYSGETVFGLDPASRRALQPHGVLLAEGELVRVEGLSSALREIAGHGAEVAYSGDLGRRMGFDLWHRGGAVDEADFADYEAIDRGPLEFDAAGWAVLTNPAPAVGGAAVAYLLARMASTGMAIGDWVEAQRSLFEWRGRSISPRVDRRAAIQGWLQALTSPSTVHVSTIDSDGRAVAATMSAGYGSGVIPEGTGMWMNNALGEFELVGEEPADLEPGTRLNSNMAPTVATSDDGRVLAIGGPGADRISTSLAQVLAHVMFDGEDLAAAVAHPRLHVDVRNGGRVAVEPGIDVDGIDQPVLEYDRLHMYFGGVGAVMRHPDGRLEAVTDPRRDGVAIVV